jgi:4-diphosphocytidyl-2-C-methyl-D-erythritol kinase
MRRATAFAKINLSLVVGPLRSDGKHEVLTVLQRVSLHDEITLEPSAALVVDGFSDDAIVRSALESLAGAARVEPGWRVCIDKRIPVAAGLGGGSADAAAALELANEVLPEPLSNGELHRLASGIGADVPFFLRTGTQVAAGDGTELEHVALPLDYDVLLLVPEGAEKQSTRAVYEAFDARDGAVGFAARAGELRRSLAAVETTLDLAGLPANDLVSSPIAAELAQAGAFRADVTGAGPAVYGLFEEHAVAEQARRTLGERCWTSLVRPVER